MEIQLHLTNTFRNELTTYLEYKLFILHAIALFCCYNRIKCSKCETCAKLHRFHILYISRGCTPYRYRYVLFLVLPFYFKFLVILFTSQSTILQSYRDGSPRLKDHEQLVQSMPSRSVFLPLFIIKRSHYYPNIPCLISEAYPVW